MTDTSGAEGLVVHPYIGNVEVAKKVHIYTNGDKFFAGKNFVVNPRQLRSLDAFLSQVTTALKPAFGAVRTIRTPHRGHRVEDISLLESGKSYVASGSEKFVRLGYAEITSLSQKSSSTSHSQSPRDLQAKRKVQVSGRIRKIKLEPIAFLVYSNGENLEPPRRILIKPWIEKDFETVLAVTNDKVALRCGAVRKLIDLSSKQEVKDIKELKHDQSYVAVGTEKFKDLDYGVHISNVSLHHQQKRRYPRLPALNKKAVSSESNGSSVETSNPELLSGEAKSHENAGAVEDSMPAVVESSNNKAVENGQAQAEPQRSAQQVAKHRPLAQGKQKVLGDEVAAPTEAAENKVVAKNEGGIPVRPLKHKRSTDGGKNKVIELEKDKETKAMDVDKDEGVYKAMRKDKNDAEVVDDSGAATEVPVDVRNAEEVIEEDAINGVNK